MTVTVARHLDEALDALQREPEAQVLAGGTDFMVEVNFGHRRPPSVVAIRGLPELRGWRQEGDTIVLGAGLTYTEMGEIALAGLLPALADAARTVGSPQIRNAGTIGGNLATGSPAGDTLPVLEALGAELELVSAGGSRRLALSEFLLAPKRTALEPGELIVAVRLPAPPPRQAFLKVGTRNAMVIAVCNLALVVDPDGRSVRCVLGAVGPVPLHASEAEAWAGAHIDWEAGQLEEGAELAEFGRLAADAARPIDDHRSTADYRRHAIGVLAARALGRLL